MKNGIIKHVNVNVKKYRKCIKDCSWNTSTCICEKSKYLKSIADASVIACDGIISVMDIVSTNMTNTKQQIWQRIVIVKKKNINLIAIFCIQFY